CGGLHVGGDFLNEVVAQFYRVDVFEDLVSAEVAGEPRIQPCGGVVGVFAAVAHEDPAPNATGRYRHDSAPVAGSSALWAGCARALAAHVRNPGPSRQVRQGPGRRTPVPPRPAPPCRPGRVGIRRGASLGPTRTPYLWER